MWNVRELALNIHTHPNTRAHTHVVEMDAHTEMQEGGWLLMGQWQGLPSPCGVPLLTEQVTEKAKDIRSYQRAGVHGMSEGRVAEGSHSLSERTARLGNTVG